MGARRRFPDEEGVDNVHSLSGTLHFIATLTVIGGLATMPFTVLRFLHLCRPAMVFATIFVISTSVSNIGLALDADQRPFFAVAHLVQGVSLIAFLARFIQQVRRAQRLVLAARAEAACTKPFEPPNGA